MSIFDIFKKSPTKIMFEALTAGNIAVLEDSIKSGADVNAKDRCGFTPLHYASFNGYKPSVYDMLIVAGADVDIVDSTAFLTPLMLSAALSPYRDTISVLCEHNAAMETKDVQGRTALMWAVSYAGFSIREQNKNHCSVLDIVKELLEWEADINAENHFGITAWDRIFDLRKNEKIEGIQEVFDYLQSRGAKTGSNPKLAELRLTYNPKTDLEFSKGLLTLANASRQRSKQA